MTCKAENAKVIYPPLTAVGAVSVGMFAETSMRIKRSLCAFGQEMDRSANSNAAGLDFVARNANAVIGTDALAAARAAGEGGRMVSVVLDYIEAAPRGHKPIFLSDEIVGRTRSCAFGFRMGRPVGLGRVDRPFANGTRVKVDIDRTRFDATLDFAPLFHPAGKRMQGN